MSDWNLAALQDLVARASAHPGFAVVLLWRNEHGIQHDALGDMSVIAEVLAPLVKADASKGP